MSVHFSSKTDVWATPSDFYDHLNREFGFTLDVCALPDNAKCDRFITPAEDGLSQEWRGICWMNPPYGRVINVEKLRHEHKYVFASYFANGVTKESKKRFAREQRKIYKRYVSTIGNWVRKAYESARCGSATVVCLIPARTDTAWWHDYCVKGDVRFIRGRLKFGGSKNPAPFPSAVVIFRAGLNGG